MGFDDATATDADACAPVESGPLRAGDTFLQKYRVRGLLGHGGHAFVYEGTDVYTDCPVAIKVITANRAQRRELAERARAEAQVLARLNHENIVRVLDGGATEGGLVYVIME